MACTDYKLERMRYNTYVSKDLRWVYHPSLGSLPLIFLYLKNSFSGKGVILRRFDKNFHHTGAPALIILLTASRHGVEFASAFHLFLVFKRYHSSNCSSVTTHPPSPPPLCTTTPGGRIQVTNSANASQFPANWGCSASTSAPPFISLSTVRLTSSGGQPKSLLTSRSWAAPTEAKYNPTSF